jgi:tight adherence protein C
MTLVICIVLFILIAAASILFGYRRYVLPGRVYEGLETAGGLGVSLENPPNPDFYSIKRLAEVIGRKLPASAATASALRLKLLSGGYREQNATATLYGLKIMSTCVVTLTVSLLELHSSTAPTFRLMAVAIGTLAGFRLPDYFLAKRIKARKKRLRRALPDALDLIIVCAEAGLTIDRSFRTVSQQLGSVHRELCDEFDLFTAELSAGLRRKEALDNLALRTQEPEMKKFVGVLTQADRFGTRVGEALRTHAEYLRIRRRQDAEEKASKVSVKLLFPILFFIFPCILLVTVGPAALVIVKQLIPLLSGRG